MKVLIYGLPKSGTTILYTWIHTALSARHADLLTVFEPNGRQPPTADSDAYLLLSRGRKQLERVATLTKALLSMQQRSSSGVHCAAVVEQFADYDKKIFIVRDPRDRVVSTFFYRWFRGHKPDLESFERAYGLTRYKEQHPGAIPFYALRSMSLPVNLRLRQRLQQELTEITQFVRSAQHSGWHIIKYEDLVDRKLGDLERYLGFELEPSENVSGELSRVARSKNYGDWRHWFTPEDVQYYKPACQAFLKAHGYDADDWALTSPKTLPDSEGSTYMRKLFEPSVGADMVHPAPWGRLIRKYWPSAPAKSSERPEK